MNNKMNKINKSVILEGDKLILCPYFKCFVNKYYQWLQNKDLQEETASEMQTLQQVIKTQQILYKDSKRSY